MRKFFGFVMIFAFMAISVYGNGKRDETSQIITIDGERVENGWLKYSTNDKRLYNAFFYEIFQNKTENVYEISARKISGGEYEGFGIIFCTSNNDENIISAYVLLITIKGQYLVGEIVNGNRPRSPVISWKRSKNIKVGYNEVNNIKVIDNGQIIIIYFNNIETDAFSKNQLIDGKNIGVYHGIGTKTGENFPIEPAEVQFHLEK